MLSQLGNIFCIDNKSDPKRYALVLNEIEGNDPTFSLINLCKVKPFEIDSITCIGKVNIKRENKKKKIVTEKVMFRISGFPFKKSNLHLYGDPVDYITLEQLQSISELVSNKTVYTKEMERLKRMKNELHEKLSELKKKRELCKFNNIHYGSIQNEMDEIVRKLGYEQSNQKDRDKFRIAPSKYISVVSGGRGG